MTSVEQRRMSRRTFTRVLGAIPPALLLTACGGTSTTEQPTSTLAAATAAPAPPTATVRREPTATIAASPSETMTPPQTKEGDPFSVLEQYGINIAGAEFTGAEGKQIPGVIIRIMCIREKMNLESGHYKIFG